MRKVLPFFLGIFLVVVVGAYWVLNYTGSNKDLATGSPYLITVEPGMTTADIANLLHKQKLVKTPEAFRLEAKFRGLERDLQAGRYEITAGMSNSEIVEVLSKGQVQRVRFTVPEGFTVVKTAKKIEAEGLGSAEKFIEAARNYTPYPYMETSDPNVIYKTEGFIFPSTYMFDIGMNEKDMLAMMVKEFNTQMNKENIPEEAEKQTKEFDASLEKETSDEIRKIREDLAREKDARINELRAETEDQLSRLDAYYEAHHENLCSELFQKITGITET